MKTVLPELDRNRYHVVTNIEITNYHIHVIISVEFRSSINDDEEEEDRIVGIMEKFRSRHVAQHFPKAMVSIPHRYKAGGAGWFTKILLEWWSDSYLSVIRPLTQEAGYVGISD